MCAARDHTENYVFVKAKYISLPGAHTRESIVRRHGRTTAFRIQALYHLKPCNKRAMDTGIE